MTERRSSSGFLGFEKTYEVIDGKPRPVARFACVECEARLAIPFKASEKMVPELLANGARLRGWKADAYVKSRCYCPDHAGRTKSNHDPESELRKMEAKMAKTAPDVVVLRDPTPDQRALIRKTIEAHFDDEYGCYMDDYSDQRVADEAGVARVVVERMRDAAFGPIRVTPELLAMRKEVADLRRQFVDQINAAQALLDQLKADSAKLLKTAAALEDKLATRAA